MRKERPLIYERQQWILFFTSIDQLHSFPDADDNFTFPISKEQNIYQSVSNNSGYVITED